MRRRHLSAPAFGIALLAVAAAASGQTQGSGDGSSQRPYSFGPDQTIVEIGKAAWEPLRLDGLPPGAEIAVLRGDLAKGGAEILLRFPSGYAVPIHSHTSDELYLWLAGAFTYVAAEAPSGNCAPRPTSACPAARRTVSGAGPSPACCSCATPGLSTCTCTTPRLQRRSAGEATRTKRSRTIDREAFEASLRADGDDEVLNREVGAGQAVPEHTHGFEVHILTQLGHRFLESCSGSAACRGAAGS